MGDVIRPPARAGVSFELERLERDGDRLVVSGHWSGLRGVRFVRPTLVAGDREVLATLEHKPWAPRADRAWTAAFPWTGQTPEAGQLSLAVAPSVTVSLGDQPPAPAEPALALVPETADAEEPEAVVALPAPPPPTGPEEIPSTDRMRARLLAQELADAERERDELGSKLERAHVLLGEADAARAELEATLRRERRAADNAAGERDDATRGHAALERERDHALGQRDEAVDDREAAVRARTRMELQREEALAARDAAAAELERAHGERDEANAQRDEVLLAYRALQRHVQTERAELDRAGDDEALDDVDLDIPIGVRKMPAARTVMAELQRPAPSSKFIVSRFDVWVVRVLGSVAAACFILLLLAIMRVFI
ncbi:MAG TPA: hypothetical protein VMY78_01305 [Solirubrobacteraceae bacterium]|nr:hypothetical protein [Solirubrobacteraceae bacterium]